ncbi:unnamed protein product [Linum trigynum]|uniref:Mitochondrial import receptor subunit TOM9-2 n=1 Tax=Linum trigynum TaxID=586398 RepID=A0AAV2CHW7_9ROSI
MVVQDKKRLSTGRGEDAGILARATRTLSESRILGASKELAGEATYVAKRLAKSTGKAAWIAGTTFLILVVPLIIEMDREAQLSEFEAQQSHLLGAPPTTMA